MLSRFALDLDFWLQLNQLCPRRLTAPPPVICPEYLALVADYCHYTHARVGFAQGPQVSDPAAAEFGNEVRLHVEWWQLIWRRQKARGLQAFHPDPAAL